MGLLETGFKKGNHNGIGDGFFANNVTITDAKDVSGKEITLPNGTVLFKQDCGVQLTYTDNDNPSIGAFNIRIGGNLKRDEQTNTVIGTGSAFKLEVLFESIEYDQKILNDDYSIKDEAIKALINSEITLLAYPNNKNKTTNWDIVGTNGKEMKNAFLNQRMKPKNYQPQNSGALSHETNGVRVTSNAPF